MENALYDFYLLVYPFQKTQFVNINRMLVISMFIILLY